jgi:hypothetical protein
MKENAADALAQWLQQNEPELFAALAARASGELAGFMDILKSVGGAIATGVSKVGSVVKTVGSFIASPSGVSALSALGSTYLQSEAQKNALQVQLAAAQAGLPPAPIETRYDPGTNTYVPVVTTSTGLQPLTPDLSSQMVLQFQQSAGFDWKKWTPWIALGAVGLGVVIWISSRD